MKRGKKWIRQYECLRIQAAKRFKRGKKGPEMALPAMKWMMPITSSCTSCTGTMVHGRRIYHVKLFYDKDYPTSCQATGQSAYFGSYFGQHSEVTSLSRTQK